ncbi:MAG: nucleoside hydrolase, partial [Bacteroidales bacterium]|nr:nucleoside hydrolase [Bacteroidales bacterium]
GSNPITSTPIKSLAHIMKAFTYVRLCMAVALYSFLCLYPVSAQSLSGFQPVAPRHVVFDTDWWTDVDDACAIRLLLQQEREGRVVVDGICLSAVRPTSVASLSAFLDYEGRPNIPLGVDREATDFTGKPSYHELIIESHPRRAADNADAYEDCVVFYRTLLARAADPIDIIAVGYPNALARLLSSKPDTISNLSGKELVTSKVRHLWMMAGKYPSGKENNFTRTARSREAGTLIATSWPTPITFLGWEIGIQVVAGSHLSNTDLLHRILVAHGSGKGRYAWDPLTVLMAVWGDPHAAGYDTVRGKLSVDATTGENVFSPYNEGPHRYVVMRHEPQWYVDYLDALLCR